MTTPTNDTQLEKLHQLNDGFMAIWRDDIGTMAVLHDADGAAMTQPEGVYIPRLTHAQMETALQPAPAEHPAYGLARRGAEAKPELAGRMMAAAELVEAGEIEIHGANEWNVIGTARGSYSITETSCTCFDHQYRGGWCKHRLAVRMARSLGVTETAVDPSSAIPAEAIRQAEELARRQRVEEAQYQRAQQFRNYCNSAEGARRYVLKAYGNGATSAAAGSKLAAKQQQVLAAQSRGASWAAAQQQALNEFERSN